MIAGYEERRSHGALLNLIERFSTGNPSKHQNRAQIEYLRLQTPRETTVALISRRVPGELSQIVSEMLHGVTLDVGLLVGELKSGTHKDVPRYYSTTLKAAFSGRFATRKELTFDTEIFSER